MCKTRQRVGQGAGRGGGKRVAKSGTKVGPVSSRTCEVKRPERGTAGARQSLFLVDACGDFCRRFA